MLPLTRTHLLEGLRNPAQFGQRAFRYLVRNAVGTITRVETDAPVAALTFDDGPHPEFTPRLIRLLERFDARATFFMLGQSAAQYPEIVKRVAEAGHAIANHTFDHPSFPLITREERLNQLRSCREALSPYEQKLFRPPYGEQSKASHFDVTRLGYKVILFDAHADDWFEPDSERMTQLLHNQVRPGSIVCLHDAIYWHRLPSLVPRLAERPLVDRRSMLKALEKYLEKAARRFRFVTVPELFRYGRPRRVDWYRVTSPGSTGSAENRG
ncbi:MAG TPA: polysaccharide deacetylase family protein [Acidobacteriota bacterium]|nr:polysaccharide deacetylase family protein [Acidobacteriota bacterium]